MESKAGFSTSGSDERAQVNAPVESHSKSNGVVLNDVEKMWGMCIKLCCKAMFAYLPALDRPMIFHMFGHNIPRWTYCDDGRGGVGNLSLSFEKVWRPKNLHLSQQKVIPFHVFQVADYDPKRHPEKSLRPGP